MHSWLFFFDKESCFIPPDTLLADRTRYCQYIRCRQGGRRFFLDRSPSLCLIVKNQVIILKLTLRKEHTRGNPGTQSLRAQQGQPGCRREWLSASGYRFRSGSQCAFGMEGVFFYLKAGFRRAEDLEGICLEMRFLMALLLLIFVHAAPAVAEDLRVFYAGFAFMGDFSSIESNYPHSFAISRDKAADGRSVLEIDLLKKMEAVQLDGVEIVFDRLADLNSGDALALACGLDNESVVVDEINGIFKVVYDLSGQVLLFDYRNMKLVASYPFAIQLIDALEKAPTADSLRGRIRSLYLTQDNGVNFFDEFVKRVQQIDVKDSYSNTIQVANVVVEDKALPFLPAEYRQDPANFRVFMAQSFNKFLSKNQGVSVLPYTKGHAIGNKMATRFCNGDIFQLTIPEADFSVDLTVRGFKKVCTDKKAAGECWVYGAYGAIRITQPLLGKTYLDEKFKHGASKIVPSSQSHVADWPCYQESMLALLDNATKSFSTERKYKELRKIMEKCR